MGVPMASNQRDPIAIKAQKIPGDPSSLIGPSNNVRTASALLNSFEHKALVESKRTFQTRNGFLWDNDHSLLNWALDSALQITNATKCNLQTVDPESSVLQIVAHRGFRQPFLDFFQYVDGGDPVHYPQQYSVFVLWLVGF